jgi:hypothetical protein
LRGIDRIIHKVRKLVVKPRGLVFLDTRHRLFAGIEPQPCVQQIPLLDRFDDRGVGALEFQGCNPTPNAKYPSIGLRREFLVKMQDCVETPLMAAFQATRWDRGHPPANRLIGRLCNSTIGESAARSLRPMPSIPPCVIRAVDGIFPAGGGRGRDFLWRLEKPARSGEIRPNATTLRGDG